MRNYTVVCEWRDANGVEDADEVSVSAESPSDACAKAKKQWRLTLGSQWPSCKLERAFAVTPKKSTEFE